MNTVARWVVMALLGVGLAGVASAQEEGGADDAKAVRDAYTQTAESANKALTGAEGLAAWEKFLADHPKSPFEEAAQREKGIWERRAEAKQARFGSQWIDAAEVEKRVADADRLVGEADAANDLDSKIKLLGEAGRAHPYRADIPFRKFEALYKADRLREAGLALGEVVNGDPNHLAARNNLGVLAAAQKQYGVAYTNFLKAGDGDNDVVLDNLDQTMAMARADKQSTGAAESQLQALVARLHREGKHVGETRWGNSWISQADYDGYQKETRESEQKITQNKSRMRQLASRYGPVKRDAKRYEDQLEKLKDNQKNSNNAKQIRDKLKKAEGEVKEIEEAAKKLKSENDDLESKQPKPSHSGRLVLLGLDGGEMGELKPPADSKEGKEGGGLFDGGGDGGDAKEKADEPRKKTNRKTDENRKNEHGGD